MFSYLAFHELASHLSKLRLRGRHDVSPMAIEELIRTMTPHGGWKSILDNSWTSTNSATLKYISTNKQLFTTLLLLKCWSVFVFFNWNQFQSQSPGICPNISASPPSGSLSIFILGGMNGPSRKKSLLIPWAIGAGINTPRSFKNKVNKHLILDTISHKTKILITEKNNF